MKALPDRRRSSKPWLMAATAVKEEAHERWVSAGKQRTAAWGRNCGTFQGPRRGVAIPIRPGWRVTQACAMCPLPWTVAKERPCSWAARWKTRRTDASRSHGPPLARRVVHHVATELGPGGLQLEVGAEEVGLPQP